MSRLIEGTYYFPKSSQAVDAQLHVNGDMVSLHYQGQCRNSYHLASLTQHITIAGVPMEVGFADGAKFSAQDPLVRLSSPRNSLESFEQNKTLIIASVVLVPALLWFVMMVLMPRLAQSSVAYLPDIVSQQMGKQAFEIIKRTMLEPSVTEEAQQQQLKRQWQDTLIALDLSPEKYTLHVYGSEFFGPNAFALPDGTVVITDDLITQLDDNSDAALAVLLHEIGHVEHQHSLSMVAQSVSSAVAFAMIFGDIEGIGEILLGTGSTLIQSKFSRNMEREADDYALAKLEQLGKSGDAFAQAMQSFLDLKGKHGDSQLLKYLASHPDTQERIDKAKNYRVKVKQ